MPRPPTRIIVDNSRVLLSRKSMIHICSVYSVGWFVVAINCISLLNLNVFLYGASRKISTCSKIGWLAMRDHARSTENGTGHILPYAIYGKNERKKYVMYHLLNRNIYDLQLHVIITYRVMNLSAVTAGNSISFSFLLRCLVRKRALAKGPFIYYVSTCRWGAGEGCRC